MDELIDGLRHFRRHVFWERQVRFHQARRRSTRSARHETAPAGMGPDAARGPHGDRTA